MRAAIDTAQTPRVIHDVCLGPLTQGIAAALCGGFLSFSLGLVGAGGAILSVPLILYAVGIRNPHMAGSMNRIKSRLARTFRSTFVVGSIVLMCSAAALAADVPSAAQMQDALRKNLGPDVDVTSVAATPLEGVYEVNLGKQIIYTDKTAKYLLVGQLIESRTRKNLTEAKLQQADKVDFTSLPLSNAIKTVKGDGSRKMAVFADPYCPYCKQLEQTVQKLDNVTIYTFLIPILTPDSKPMSEAIWCAPDKDAAWSAWMLGARKPAPTSPCNALAVTSNLALARGLGVSGTPTIIFADGHRRTGALSLDELNNALDANKS
jgi:thiol:disulfide interchange protein DsbC